MGETPAFICCHLFFDKGRPILLVGRSGGDWQLLCGAAHGPGEGRPRLVRLNYLLSRDPSLCEILDLPDGWEAERKILGGKWTRRPRDPEAL
jgi:hypothetical protein